MTARFVTADVFDGLAALADNSVDMVMTSPPFLALRSYLPADHPDKAAEIGSEGSPAEFIDRLLDVVEALDRVLAPHGSICFELGDTYSGSGGAGGDYAAEGMREGQPTFTSSSRRSRAGGEWPLDKSLCGIPTLFAWSLAYGRNLLNPARETPRWRVRNLVAWCHPNPPVGALADKFRPATSYLTIACKERDRYFDLDAVRRSPATVKDQRLRTTNGRKSNANPAEVRSANYTQRVPCNPAGAPPLDWWEIPSEPYSGAHYATYPETLCVVPIQAMCPLRVCTVCGQPSRRIAAEYVTVGWTCCGHCSEYDPTPHGTHEEPCGPINHWRTGVVLDPFCGTGTTLAVATGHGRDAIGIDIDHRNADLALGRVGPLILTIQDKETVA